MAAAPSMEQPVASIGYKIRAALAEDAAVISHHRAAMWIEIGATAEAARAVDEASIPRIRAGIESGTFVAWVVEFESQVIASGGMLFNELLPTPSDLTSCREAYVLNMYTQPAHRRRGIARHLMDTMIEWCKQRGIKSVALHASEFGKPLYTQLGFVPTNEMRLLLP